MTDPQARRCLPCNCVEVSPSACASSSPLDSSFGPRCRRRPRRAGDEQRRVPGRGASEPVEAGWHNAFDGTFRWDAGWFVRHRGERLQPRRWIRGVLPGLPDGLARVRMVAARGRAGRGHAGRERLVPPCPHLPVRTDDARIHGERRAALGGAARIVPGLLRLHGAVQRVVVPPVERRGLLVGPQRSVGKGGDRRRGHDGDPRGRARPDPRVVDRGRERRRSRAAGSEDDRGDGPRRRIHRVPRLLALPLRGCRSCPSGLRRSGSGRRISRS